MPKSLLKYAAQLGLPLTLPQAEKLVAYAQCVWDKKNQLNLTSAQTFEELLARHICDGLTAAARMHALGLTHAQLADMGAGCGYIGMTLAVALPHAQITLVESIEKRCKFMNWAAMQTAISNVHVKQARLGQGTHFAFDLVTERAMGTLPDIMGICMGAVKAGGIFMAFQGENPQTAQVAPTPLVEDFTYQLPGDSITRHLVVFRKENA